MITGFDSQRNLQRVPNIGLSNCVLKPSKVEQLPALGSCSLRGGGHHGGGHGHGHGHDDHPHLDEQAVREAMRLRSERIARTERVATFIKVVTGVGGLGSFLWFISL